MGKLRSEMTPEQVEAKRAWARENYRKNREKIVAQQMVWNAANPDKFKAAQKRYRKKNPEKVREIKRKWAERNPEKMKEYHRRYQEKRRAAKAELDG